MCSLNVWVPRSPGICINECQKRIMIDPRAIGHQISSKGKMLAYTIYRSAGFSVDDGGGGG